jgi:hypothetical protein
MHARACAWMPQQRVVLRLSVQGFQAKQWDTHQLAANVAIFNIRMVAVAGRVLIVLARNTSQTNDPSMPCIVHALVCETAQVATEIALRIMQLSRTVAESLRGETPFGLFCLAA